MRKTAPINRAEIDENLVDTKTINVYTPKELSEFLHCSQKHGNLKIGAYFRTLAYTGARKSRLLAKALRPMLGKELSLLIQKP